MAALRAALMTLSEYGGENFAPLKQEEKVVYHIEKR